MWQQIAAKVGLFLVVLLLVAFSSFRVTYNYCKGQEAKRLLEAKELSSSIEKELTEAVQQAKLDLFNKQETIRTVTKTIYKEIPEAIRNEVDIKFPVSNFFVRMYDSAASMSEVSGDGARDDAAAEDVKETTVISTTADNFETCNIQREQLIVWQKTYLEYQKQMEQLK